jgi:hypothetical protein
MNKSAHVSVRQPATAVRRLIQLAAIATLANGLGACASMNLGGFGGEAAVTQEPPPPPEIPSTIRSEEIVGNWGLAAFHKPDDRRRTEAAARNQCKNPYVISAGPTGGVIMYLADEPKPVEVRLKGAPGGKNYIGPAGPAGGEKDREVLSFDGRVMLTKYVDPDAASRYGTEVYVRCAPRP